MQLSCNLLLYQTMTWDPARVSLGLEVEPFYTQTKTLAHTKTVMLKYRETTTQTDLILLDTQRNRKEHNIRNPVMKQLCKL